LKNLPGLERRLRGIGSLGYKRRRPPSKQLQGDFARQQTVAQKARRIDMSEQRNGERIWDIIERVGVCMLTTQAAGRLRARPLEARPDRKAGFIFAVTDVHSAKQDEIEAAPDVGLVVIDAKAKAYLSITARACVMRDTAKIAQVWRRPTRCGGRADRAIPMCACCGSSL